MIDLHAMSFVGASSLFVFCCLCVLIFPPVNAISNSTLDRSLGINCRGSSLCPSDPLAADYIGIILEIAYGLAKCNPQSRFNCGPLDDKDFYQPGANIICLPQGKSFLGGICAFTQGNVGAGVLGVLVKQKLEQLSTHGCKICGSVPLANNNDPTEAGILTVNYISGTACAGLCPPTHYSAPHLLVDTYRE